MSKEDAGRVADGNDERRELVARVATHDEALAADVASRLDEADAAAADLAEAEDRVEELTERLQRTQADFQNYKKRAKEREEDLRERATADLVERLVDVRDNLARALDAEGDEADLREGVEATLRSFDDVLDEEGVDRIEPAPGDEVDPHRHEVMMNVESDQEPGTVADCYQPGYEMGGTVLRAARVAVSEDED